QRGPGSCNSPLSVRSNQLLALPLSYAHTFLCPSYLSTLRCQSEVDLSAAETLNGVQVHHTVLAELNIEHHAVVFRSRVKLHPNALDVLPDADSRQHSPERSVLFDKL